MPYTYEHRYTYLGANVSGYHARCLKLIRHLTKEAADVARSLPVYGASIFVIARVSHRAQLDVQGLVGIFGLEDGLR
jgi:hypothetical protein